MNPDAPRSPSFRRSHFARVLADLGDRGPAGELVSVLAGGDLTEAAFDGIVDAHGVRREPWFRGQLLDLVLGYIQAALADGSRLNSAQQADVHWLRHHFGIKDGEFMERRPAEVATILNDQFERILDDGIIDGEEELYQVELQAAFGIGYDDYLAVCRRAFENAYSKLSFLAQRSSDAAGKLQTLEPLYRLATSRPRSLGGLY